jgi:hypothetical protein
MISPRYPEIEVRVASAHPLVLIGATRQALRRAGVAKPQIQDFSDQAFASDDAPAVCRQWVRVVAPEAGALAR